MRGSQLPSMISIGPYIHGYELEHIIHTVFTYLCDSITTSSSAPLKYLDRIKTTQMDSLRLFVSRVESSFRHSMMLSMVKREVLKNDVTREKVSLMSVPPYIHTWQILAAISYNTIINAAKRVINNPTLHRLCMRRRWHTSV